MKDLQSKKTGTHATGGRGPARGRIEPTCHGFRRSVAVVIGINNYNGRIARLDAAAPDALLLTEHLRRFQVALLTDGRATKQGIEASRIPDAQ